MDLEKSPALVILAAGIGSRYGGFKQLDAIGINGEPIMELSIIDAIKAGFQKIVLVVNRQILPDIKTHLIEKYRNQVEICYTIQELDDLPTGFQVPDGREKPWGTAHAILASRSQINTPFAVINADDFYGTSAYRLMHDNLSQLSSKSERYIALGYLLSNTLSKHGGVSRGLCDIKENSLTSIQEVINIRQSETGIFGEFRGEKLELSPQAVVSMNFWGFTPQVFSLLEERFKDFLRINQNDPKAEFFITDALDYAINNNHGKVKVLITDEKWYGVTFLQDRDEVRNGIQQYLKNI